MVQRAAGFVARTGPVTAQDRWEEDGGYAPFTLAVAISGLLVAADVAEQLEEIAIAVHLRQTADNWNANIERWTYVTSTELAQVHGVDGYYVRIGMDAPDEDAPTDGWLTIKNRPFDQSNARADHIVSPDALALVRFGLRAADDPRILNTIKVIDAELKVELPPGPSWHRYNEDGYGEHEDGSPFDGTGIGRAWPLLTGELAHYELAASNHAEATRLLHAMEGFANEGGLYPEQVWTGGNIPERELVYGRPSGSAMPLVWAHAEFVKLRRSLQDGVVFDMPLQPVQRYQTENVLSPYTIWRFNHKCRAMCAGTTLRIELLASATIHWSIDNWQTVHDITASGTGLGLYVADLATVDLSPTTSILFTFLWTDAQRWEGSDFTIQVVEPS